MTFEGNAKLPHFFETSTQNNIFFYREVFNMGSTHLMPFSDDESEQGKL